MIPRILHRTLPAEPRPEVEGLWETVVGRTVGWERRTYQSPRDPDCWPETGHLFALCPDRSMESNLVRFEALWEHGGVYVDSDVSLVRPLEPLLKHRLFVGLESASWLGMAVIGAVPRHPAVRVALDAMMAHVAAGGPRSTCPRVVTPLWRDRRDVTVLPPSAFYPVPYGQTADGRDFSDDPRVFAVHHWHGSWL
jgi:mannosyltransferase OCH1-like enzyme